ncbi:MAG TPA: sulfatase-like hydrolase/transferase [Gemmataceae bacterium]
MGWRRWRRWLGWEDVRNHQALRDAEDFLLITWDSCRYDAYQQARTPVLDAHATARPAWAMATYTLPAHVAMFQGFLPHVAAPEPLYNRFCQQLWRISHRNLLVKPLVTFPKETRSIADGLRARGYLTAGSAALDWFRDAPVLREGFEHFSVPGTMARLQNEELIRLVEREARDRPCFVFVNYGETHSPFRHEGMPKTGSGVDERFRRRHLYNQAGVFQEKWTFDEEAFRRQVACAEYLDARTGELLELFRRRGRPTTVVICGDHGECFGENGLWGHAFYHEKVMQVPMLIFRLNAPPHPAPEPSEFAKAA